MGVDNTDIYQLPKLLLASVIQPWLHGSRTVGGMQIVGFLPKVLLDNLHREHDRTRAISVAQALWAISLLLD